MTGLGQLIEGLGHEGTPGVMLAVGLLLGLRHATDPDHLVAVSTLVASERKRRLRRAGKLGLAWGAGHATTLLLLGLPLVLLAALLPETVSALADALVGAIVMLLAVGLFRRWRRGEFHAHEHRHGDVVHRHLHAHAREAGHAHAHRVRSPLAAYGIGAVHGVGGSAGIVLLLIAGVADRAVAAAALVLFALATALAMAVLSAALGLALAAPALERRLEAVLPAFAALAFAFGGWYAAGALGEMA